MWKATDEQIIKREETLMVIYNKRIGKSVLSVRLMDRKKGLYNMHFCGRRELDDYNMLCPNTIARRIKYNTLFFFFGLTCRTLKRLTYNEGVM